MIRTLCRLLCVAGLLATLVGCESLRYYQHGIGGQMKFYGAREPIAKLLAKPDLSAETRRKLELVPRITAFAKDELKLPVKGQYRDYVQLDRPVVLWSVFAAPELSLEPYQWCYGFHLICVEYRGYFSEDMAKQYTAKLAGQGYDTYVGGVAAFSSLGLFDDPVTSVLTSYPDDLLASVLIHELAHSVVYVKDDTAFNESFASAVAEAGMARWLAKQAGTAAGEGAAASRGDFLTLYRAQQALVTEVALALRAELAELYASALADAEKRQRKQALLAGAGARFLVQCRPRFSEATCQQQAAWFVVQPDGSGLSNARLNAVATYEHLVPAFTALLAAHEGDFAAFYATVIELGEMPRAQRERVLRALQDSASCCTAEANDRKPAP